MELLLENTNPLLGVELLEEERKLNCCSKRRGNGTVAQRGEETEMLLEEERKLNCVHTVPGRSKQTPIRS